MSSWSVRAVLTIWHPTGAEEENTDWHVIRVQRKTETKIQIREMFGGKTTPSCPSFAGATSLATWRPDP